MIHKMGTACQVFWKRALYLSSPFKFGGILNVTDKKLKPLAGDPRLA